MVQLSSSRYVIFLGIDFDIFFQCLFLQFFKLFLIRLLSKCKTKQGIRPPWTDVPVSIFAGETAQKVQSVFSKLYLILLQFLILFLILEKPQFSCKKGICLKNLLWSIFQINFDIINNFEPFLRFLSKEKITSFCTCWDFLRSHL